MDEPNFSPNTPKDLEAFSGQFVVFFTEDTNPKVLFSSFIAEEAYKLAAEIKERESREPLVYRVPENLMSNVSHVLEFRY